MTYEFQIVVDAADPHTLAEWWADLLGWQVEPSKEDFIREMVAQGHAPESATKTHQGVLVWREGQAILHPDGSGRRILFMLVPEGKTVKNRIHLDLRIGEDKREAELERLTALGAKELHRGRQGPHWWITIADPEGNELCLS